LVDFVVTRLAFALLKVLWVYVIDSTHAAFRLELLRLKIFFNTPPPLQKLGNAPAKNQKKSRQNFPQLTLRPFLTTKKQF
jgi:hypothetical protein